MTNEEAKAVNRQLNLDIEAEHDRHEKACKELNQRIADLKKACPHEEVWCYSSSGGPDSSGCGYVCEVCRKELGLQRPVPPVKIKC